jgi:hypothetical protein
VLGAETGDQDGIAVGEAEGATVKRVDIGANVPASMGDCVVSVVLVPNSIVVGTMGAMLVGDCVLANGVMVGACTDGTAAVELDVGIIGAMSIA